MKDKETYLFSKPQGFRTIRFHLAAEAIEWLDGTTKDDDDNAIGNHTLFYNLLSRMRLIPGRDGSFRRPQELQAGQLQFSETGLAEEWHMGRKKVRNLFATMERLDVTRNFAASLFRNIKYFTLRKLYLCRKWMQKRLQKTTTTGITLPNFDFLA